MNRIEDCLIGVEAEITERMAAFQGPKQRVLFSFLPEIREILFEKVTEYFGDKEKEYPAFFSVTISDLNCLEDVMKDKPQHRVIKIQHNIESRNYEVFLGKKDASISMPIG